MSSPTRLIRCILILIALIIARLLYSRTNIYREVQNPSRSTTASSLGLLRVYTLASQATPATANVSYEDVQIILCLHWHKVGTIACNRLADAFGSISTAATVVFTAIPASARHEGPPHTFKAHITMKNGEEWTREVHTISRSECTRVDMTCFIERAHAFVPDRKLFVLGNLGSYGDWESLSYMWHGSRTFTGEEPVTLHHAIWSWRLRGAPRLVTVVMHRAARHHLTSCVRYHGWNQAERIWTEKLHTDWLLECKSLLRDGEFLHWRRCKAIFGVFSNASFYEVVRYDKNDLLAHMNRALAACAILLRDTVHGQMSLARLFDGERDAILLDVDALAHSPSLDTVLAPLCRVASDALRVPLSRVRGAVSADVFRVGRHITRNDNDTALEAQLDDALRASVEFLQALVGVSLAD